MQAFFHHLMISDVVIFEGIEMTSDQKAQYCSVCLVGMFDTSLIMIKYERNPIDILSTFRAQKLHFYTWVQPLIFILQFKSFRESSREKIKDTVNPSQDEICVGIDMPCSQVSKRRRMDNSQHFFLAKSLLFLMTLNCYSSCLGSEPPITRNFRQNL